MLKTFNPQHKEESIESRVEKTKDMLDNLEENMEPEVKKDGRGGARPNAGRKKKGVKYYGFRATEEVFEILENVPDKTSYICNAILFYEKHKL